MAHASSVETVWTPFPEKLTFFLFYLSSALEMGPAEYRKMLATTNQTTRCHRADHIHYYVTAQQLLSTDISDHMEALVFSRLCASCRRHSWWWGSSKERTVVTP